AFLLQALGLPLPPLLVALALTTTAIGTLLPILRDAGELSRDFGILALAAGAMGEFGPLLLLSLLPLEEGHATMSRVFVVIAFAAIAVVAGLVVVFFRTPRIVAMLQRHLHKTSQLPVRLALLLVAVLVIVAKELGLEILLGAFAGGMIIGMVSRGQA